MFQVVLNEKLILSFSAGLIYYLFNIFSSKRTIQPL